MQCIKVNEGLIPGSYVAAIRLIFYNLPGHRPTSIARSDDQASSLTSLFDLSPHLDSLQRGLLVASCRRCLIVFYTRIPAHVQLFCSQLHNFSNTMSIL